MTLASLLPASRSHDRPNLVEGEGRWMRSPRQPIEVCPSIDINSNCSAGIHKLLTWILPIQLIVHAPWCLEFYTSLVLAKTINKPHNCMIDAKLYVTVAMVTNTIQPAENSWLTTTFNDNCIICILRMQKAPSWLRTCMQTDYNICLLYTSDAADE